jgi:hypothetical protein
MRGAEVGATANEVCLIKATFSLAGKTIVIYLKHCSNVAALNFSDTLGF